MSELGAGEFKSPEHDEQRELQMARQELDTTVKEGLQELGIEEDLLPTVAAMTKARTGRQESVGLTKYKKDEVANGLQQAGLINLDEITSQLKAIDIDGKRAAGIVLDNAKVFLVKDV